MSAELKPCAHCGTAVDWCECNACSRVWCKACDVMTELPPPGDDANLEACRAHAASIWNRRAPVASAPVLTDEDILLLVCDYTGKRINLRVDECRSHIDFARAIIARITGEGE